MHRCRGRRVLDQLDQPIAEHDLAGRDRDVAADLKLLDAGGTLAAQRTVPVVDEIERARAQVGAALAHRALEDLRIGRDEVGRRHHVQELARAERDHPLVLPRDAAHAGRRVVPPLLRQQEALVDRVEGRLAPRLVDEAPVLRQRLDARRRPVHLAACVRIT